MIINASFRYGAVELKGVYNRNLGKALVISSLSFCSLVAIYFLQVRNGRTLVGPIALPRLPITICPVADPPKEAVSNGVPEGPGGGSPAEPPKGPLPRELAVPVALNDPQLREDSASFPSLSESLLMNRRSTVFAEGGSGDGNGGRTRNGIDSSNGGFGTPEGRRTAAANEDLMEAPVFIPHEVEPTYDFDELNRRLNYPELARRNHIEGTVVLSVFVGNRGQVVKTVVEHSDNQLLDPAAIEAISRTSFTPATQNGQAVGVWVTIPVTFKLD